MNENRLTYVWHDCFVYESKSCVIVFDFWKLPGNFSEDNGGVDKFGKSIAELAQCKSVYVLVSHHHKDHFNRGIFGWHTQIPNIHYIISKDTERSCRYLLKEKSSYTGRYRVEQSKVSVIRPGEEYADNTIKVRAFGSTDIGNSYVVEADGLTLFHAGDLNAWVWRDESEAQEVETALHDYKSKIAEIATEYSAVDYAMFPVDGRMGKDCGEGASIFVRMIYAGTFIPMHFCLYEDEAQRRDYVRKATDFVRYANPARGHYASMTEPYEKLILQHHIA